MTTLPNKKRRSVITTGQVLPVLTGDASVRRSRGADTVTP